MKVRWISKRQSSWQADNESRRAACVVGFQLLVVGVEKELVASLEFQVFGFKFGARHGHCHVLPRSGMPFSSSHFSSTAAFSRFPRHEISFIDNLCNESGLADVIIHRSHLNIHALFCEGSLRYG